MRRFALHIALLLVWCIGFQPVAQAMGMHDGFAGPAEMTTQAMVTGDDSLHGMHGQKCHMEKSATTKAPVAAASGGCQCGGHCAMPGCVGAVAAIAPMTFARAFDRLTDSFVVSEVPVRPLAAHGLDLIRPPSKS